MLQRLLRTGNDAGPAILRITLGLVLFPHGAQKALGWFGGAGWTGTIDYFADQLGVPPVLTVLVILGEFLGSLALIAGAFTRVAAAGVVATQIGAIMMVHLSNGFFMNWFGSQAGEGFEYGLLAIAMALALVVAGAGRGSLDRRLAPR